MADFRETVDLLISAQTEGGDRVGALAAEIERLATEGGDAAPKLQALAQELRNVGGQQQALTEFAALKRETADLGDQMAAAQAKIDGLAAEIAAAGAAATQAAQAQAAASAKLDEAKSRHDALRQSVAAEAAALKVLKAQAAESAKSATSPELDAARERYAALKLATAGAANELRFLKQRLQEASAGAAGYAAQADGATRATQTWRDFVAQRMGPVMRQFAQEGVSHAEAHTRAIRQIAAEWKVYKASATASVASVAEGVKGGGAAVSAYAAQIKSIEARLREYQAQSRAAAAEVRNLSTQARQSAAAMGAAEVGAAKERLAGYGAAAKAAGGEVRTLAADQKAATDTLKAAQAGERALSDEYDRAVGSAKRLSGELGTKARALDATREKLTAAGVDTAKLTAEQKRLDSTIGGLVQRIVQERDAAASANPALRTLGTAAEQTAAAMGRLGIRSSAQIQAEINQINQDLIRLGADAKVSAADLDRAFAASQSRIAGLQKEMAGLVDPFTASVGKASGGLGGLLTKLKPIGAAVAAAFAVDHLVRAAVEFDRINRSLEAITGSAARAAQELGYITATANRLGLELGSASKSYAQFLAATKGTALEGQKARTIFESVAGAMAKLGKSGADTEGALLAISQMVSKGTVSMEELRLQLAERLPGAMQAAANGAGVTVAQLTKMVETGDVLAEDLLPGMAAELNKLYGTSGKVEGFTASWNRFTGAIEEAAGRIAQTDVVSKAVTVTLGALQETVLILGTGILTVTEGVSLLGRTLGATAAAITSGNWSQLKDAITEMASESADRINALAEKTLIAKTVTGQLGDAVATTAQQALQGNAGWLAVAAAYTTVGKAAEDYVKQAEKALAARQAEMQAAVALAQAGGNEVSIRQAEADGAQAVADATAKVAEAKAAQLATMQSELAAKQQVIAADGQESDAKRKIITDLQTKIALQQEDTDKARAAAQAAELEAAASAARAEAVRDNSARLEELRAAYDAATAAVTALNSGEQAATATSQQVAAAQAEAVRATILYRDALADTRANIQAQSRAQQAAIGVEARLAQLKLAQIHTSEQIARGLGNERYAQWQVIDAKREESKLAELRARQLQVEAEAQLKTVEAKREELQAMGQLTPAKVAELEAAKASATAKQIEGKISAELAKQLNAEADAAIRAMNAKRGAGDAGRDMGAGAEEGAQGVQQLSQAASGASSVAQAMAQNWLGAIDAIGQVSPVAADAVREVYAASSSFHELENRVDGLSRSAQQLVTAGPLGELKQQLEAVRAKADEAAASAKALAELARFSGAGFDGYYKSIAAMERLQASLYRAKQAQVELSIETEKYNEAVDDGSLNLAEQESRLQGLVSTARKLGSEQLSGLRSALASVRSQMQSLRADAKQTLSSISDQYDELNGRFVAQARRQAEQQRAQVEAQLAQAKAAGDHQAVADLQQALSKLSELERARVEEAKAREAESKANAQSAANAKAATTAPVATRHEVTINLNGKSKTISVASDGDAATLTAMLQQLESDMARAN